MASMIRKQMTSKQRLWAALNGDHPDRVPIWMLYPREKLNFYADVHHLPSYKNLMPTIWHKTDWFDRRSIPAPMFYSSAVHIETRFDQSANWTVTRRILRTPLGDLTSEHHQDMENAAGAMTEYFCKDIVDLEKILSIPYVPVDPDISELHNASKKLGEAGLMMVNLGMPIGTAYHCVHPQTFALWTLTERERLVHFTRIMFERQIIFLRKALQAGAGPVFFSVGTEFIAPPMCAPTAFDFLITPFDAPMFDIIHRYGGKVIVHHHGNVDSILERIAGLGADGIQPVEEPPVGDCTMSDAKKRVGDRMCIIGSVQYDDFARLTPDGMEALVKRQLGDAAAGGGMILAPTAGPYATHLTKRQQENTLHFIEAGLKWGRYPLHL